MTFANCGAPTVCPVPIIEVKFIIGADVVTLPAGVLEKMLGHSLTDKGLKAFLSDWEKLQSELSNKA